MNFTPFSDVVKEFDNVDDPDVLERIKTSRPLRIALEMCRPQNWWGTGVDPQKLLKIAHDEGIPLAWVPQSKILMNLVDAEDAQARTQVLIDSTMAIIDKCEETLNECNDPWLESDSALAHLAVLTHRDGHYQAAMALAVCLGEPLAAWAATPRIRCFSNQEEQKQWEEDRKKSKYSWAEKELTVVGLNVSRYQFKQQVLMAPIPRFFVRWYPTSNDSMPENLSRHVVAHRPTLQHFSERNALIALMLITSILREQQAWSEEVRATDAEYGVERQ